MKRKLTSEEIMKLPKDEFIKYMETVKKELYDALNNVGDPNYSNYSLEQKVTFWCERLNRQMRNQAEAGLDEYISFTPLWYNTMKRIEPELDLIIEKVFEKFRSYQWDWNRDYFLKRINDKQN